MRRGHHLSSVVRAMGVNEIGAEDAPKEGAKPN
jgi:hypothetical protein